MNETTDAPPAELTGAGVETLELAELIKAGVAQLKEPVELYTALAEAKKAFGEITRDRTVEVRKRETNVLLYTYKYATLGNILAAVTKPLAEQGLVLIQRVVHPNGAQFDYVETRLAHKSGQTIANLTRMIQTEEGQVGFAKAQTYARRYGVSLLLCLAAEEDQDAQNADEDAEVRDARPRAEPSADDGPPVDPEWVDNYARRILDLLDNQDPKGAANLMAELNQNEQVYLFSKGGLTMKQKDALIVASGRPTMLPAKPAPGTPRRRS